jgi:CBS domain-containing protein
MIPKKPGSRLDNELFDNKFCRQAAYEFTDLGSIVYSALPDRWTVHVFFDGCPVGIFTERDVVSVFASGDCELERLPVERRMACALVLGSLSMSVDDALGLMTERRFRIEPRSQSDSTGI